MGEQTGNYRRVSRTVTIQGVSFSIPNSATIISLMDQTNNANAVDTFSNAKNGVLYTPTIAPFRILGFKIRTGTAGGGTIAIYKGDIEDAVTTLLFTLSQPPVPDMDVEYAMDLENTIPVGKYLVLDPSTTQTEFIQCIGYEKT